MMPDLGRYAFEVTSSYVVSLALLAGLILWFLARGAKMRRQLAEIEARRGRKDA